MDRPTTAAPLQIQRIPLEQIRPSPQRHYFGVHRLGVLEERMRIFGLVNPIEVRRANDGYEIVNGLKRWWAARLLGWRSIDAKVLV